MVAGVGLERWGLFGSSRSVERGGKGEDWRRQGLFGGSRSVKRSGRGGTGKTGAVWWQQGHGTWRQEWDWERQGLFGGSRGVKRGGRRGSGGEGGGVVATGA